MRGWSSGQHSACASCLVIPANAGVILLASWVSYICFSYPRECGGDPRCEQWLKRQEALSPRMRGWSSHCGLESWLHDVIPANAGVILLSSTPVIALASYPRECGGDPVRPHSLHLHFMLSPRMRGWSSWMFSVLIFVAVIPANAGVILADNGIVLITVSYPRECGGDPACPHSWAKEPALSPRMRGWS